MHTEYSLVDGIVRVPDLMAAVAASGMPAIALTDQSNLFAMVKFYKEALSAGVGQGSHDRASHAYSVTTARAFCSSVLSKRAV